MSVLNSTQQKQYLHIGTCLKHLYIIYFLIIYGLDLHNLQINREKLKNS